MQNNTAPVADQQRQHIRVKKHWFWLLRDAAPAIGMTITGVVFIFFGAINSFPLFYVLALLLIIIGSGLWMLEVYQFEKSYFTLTQADFIEHLQTAFTFNDSTLHYNLIREVRVKQKPFGQMLGFAQVEIDEGGADVIALPYVVNHQEIKEYLIPRVGPPMPTAEPAVVTVERGDELKELEIPDSRRQK